MLRISRIAFILLVAIKLYAQDALADATVAFTINDRSPSVPTARVRWSFALASAPTATTSMTIAGQTATLGGGFVCVPRFGVTCPDTSNDRFRLDLAPAFPNGVSLLYEVRSHFTESDFCNLRATLPHPIFPKVVSINFTGPVINQHALVTYTVAGQTAGTTYFCQQARRRVSTAAAIVSTAPPGAMSLSRHPIDVILVLDRSGSMSWELPGAPIGSIPTRWTVLGTALDQFEALWEQASEADVTGDRLGVVLFDTNAIQRSFGTDGNFKRRDGTVVAGDTHAWDEVLRSAKSLPPYYGSTAIGKGLNLAFINWIADPNKIDAAIILMTDGEQNVEPEIVKITGTNDWALDDPSDAITGPVELYRKGLPIQTIGFGTPATVEAQLLGGIAEQTAGTSIVTATAMGLASAMQDVLVRALKGNTLGLLARTEEMVVAPNFWGTPLKLKLDPSVKRATFALNWTGRIGLFDLVLQPPGGGNAVTFTARKEGANWLVASVDIPANGPSGEWTAIVRGRDMSQPAPYQLSAYTVDSKLKYALHFNRGRAGTGDALRLAAEVSYNSSPLTGIPGGIRLTLDGPAEGIGNILHASTEKGEVPAGSDQISAYTAKVLALARSGVLSKISPRPKGTQLTLVDTGRDGDEFAGDGVYTTTFDDTSVPGRYRFNVVLEWDDPRTGKVRRIETIEREVHVVADPSSTLVEVLPATADGTYTVRVTPQDRFGNYMGPGYGNRVSATVKGGTVIGSITDPDQNGVYALRIGGVAPGTTATATIIVDNVDVQSGMAVVPGMYGGNVRGKYAVWLGLGSTLPQGSFSNNYDTGFAGNLGFEYALSTNIAVEGTLGVHRFSGKGTAQDINVTQLAVNGKWYLPPRQFKPFVTLGLGSYSFDPGSTKQGVNVGVGVQIGIAPHWSVEGRYTQHMINDNSPNSQYSTALVDLRYAY